MDVDSGRVIQFPGTRQMSSQEQSHKITNIDGMKYYSDQQIKLLRRTVRDRAALDLERNQVTAIREWMAVDLITSSGIRVSEAANIRCGDLRASYGESALFVRDGKGAKSRTAQIPDALKRHLKQFIVWKQA